MTPLPFRENTFLPYIEDVVHYTLYYVRRPKPFKFSTELLLMGIKEKRDYFREFFILLRGSSAAF